MAIHELDETHLPLIQQLLAVLRTEPDPVRQQMALEIVGALHAIRLGNDAEFVASSMHKHMQQIILQWRMEEPEQADAVQRWFDPQ
jgi:hypothetical protein